MRGELINEKVYTNQLEWLPKGSEYPPEEENKFTSFTQAQDEFVDDPISPTQGDILLAKMVAGQEIELEAGRRKLDPGLKPPPGFKL